MIAFVRTQSILVLLAFGLIFSAQARKPEKKVPLVTLDFTVNETADLSFPEEKMKKIAYSKKWLNALYYVSDDDGYLSKVVTPSFFINKKSGTRDPLAELKSNLKLFSTKYPPAKRNPQCHFPARYQFLREHFQLLPAVECPNYKEWSETFNPNQIDLVYTSQYVSNPASVFGHLFLLLPSAKQVESFWLTFNFAADISSDVNILAYIYGGLTGWYRGGYSVMPYYNRLYQYGNIEDRNLWRYRLKLTPEELDDFLRHMWELVHRAQFTYYFMDDNCAGVLMRTFAAIFLEISEAADLDTYVHPLEVIQTLKEADRLEEIKFIPSAFRKVRYALDQLDSKETDEFHDTLDDPSKIGELNNPLVADALVQYISHRRLSNAGELDKEDTAFEKSTFIRRAQLPITAPIKIAADLSQSPDKAHGSALITTGFSIAREKAAANFGLRYVGHDILDPAAGYLKNSSVEFMNILLNARDDGIWLQRATLFRVENILHAHDFIFKGSWRVRIEFLENLLTPSMTDQFFRSTFSYGVAADTRYVTPYLLASININAGANLLRENFELGPEVGLMSRIGPVVFFTSAFLGESYFGDLTRTSMNINSGLSYTFNRSFNIRSEFTHEKLIDTGLDGRRFNFGLRYNY